MLRYGLKYIDPTPGRIQDRHVAHRYNTRNNALPHRNTQNNTTKE